MGKSIDRINAYLAYEFLGSGSPTTSGSFYVDLSTAIIANDGSGSVAISGGEYSTVVLAKTENNWTEPYEGEVTNAVVISFPSGSIVSSTDWGTIKSIVISDSTSGSIPVYFYNLPTEIDAPEGTQIIFGGGTLKFNRTIEGG